MSSTSESAPQGPDDGHRKVGPREATPHPEPTEQGERFAQLHAELSVGLERIAWAILRDWQLAADAVQDAFALLAAKGPEVADEHCRGWLVRTVQLRAKNLRRKQNRAAVGSDLVREQFFRNALSDSNAGREFGPVRLEREEDLKRIESAIAQLPAAQRLVVRKRLGEELGFAEIANELDLPLGTVLSRMRLALEKLREKLNDE